MPEGERAAQKNALLVGVALADVSAPNKGNLAIVLGSHLALARVDCAKGGALARQRGDGNLAEPPNARLDAVLRGAGFAGSLADLAPPAPLLLLTGGALIAHLHRCTLCSPTLC